VADRFEPVIPSEGGWWAAGRILGFVLAILAGVVVVAPLALLAPVGMPFWLTPLPPTLIILAATWAFARMDDTSLAALGLPFGREAFRPLALGFLVGAALILATFLLIALPGTVAYLGDAGTAMDYFRFLALALLFFALAAALEELLFRGYAFRVLESAAGPLAAVLVSSALFALAHGWNPNVALLGLANIFLAGVLLAVAYLRTRSLWFVTALHAGWNWVMAAVLDAPVSGIEQLDTPLYDLRVGGPSWWSGGTFGPEAGVPATLVLAAATAWFWRSRRAARLGGEPPGTAAREDEP
jgi:uncharacterized protein